MKHIVNVEKLKRIIVQRDGNVAVLAALAMAALIGMAAVVVEGGMVYAVKMHLQKTANATVLSGAQELLATEQNVRNVGGHILQDHGETASLVNMSVAMRDRTTVVLKKEVNMEFAKVLGFDKVPVTVKATAKIESMGAAVGAAPIGIDESIHPVFGQEYRLKVDQTGSTTGNFGILALGGTGASTYKTNLTYGYKEMLSVGDVIDTQTGNIAGDTRDAVQDRINRSPYTEGDYSHRDDTRILLVPVYKAYNYSGSGQIKQIQIAGFAYFYLTAPMDYSSKEVIGIFIERTGTGIVKPEAVNRGAYAIKLTE